MKVFASALIYIYIIYNRKMMLENYYDKYTEKKFFSNVQT